MMGARVLRVARVRMCVCANETFLPPFIVYVFRFMIVFLKKNFMDCFYYSFV